MLSALTYLMTPRRPAVVDSTRDRSASDLESEDEITKVEDLSVHLKRDESERNRICPSELPIMFVKFIHLGWTNPVFFGPIPLI